MLARLASSSFDWWREAGVDTAIDEAPRNWLARDRPAAREDADAQAPIAPPISPAEARPKAPPPPRAAEFPADLVAFRTWLLTDAAIPGQPGQRFDAIGDPASGTAIVIDMPEAGDRAEGRLLGGEAGDLFDRMLVPMQLSRDLAYLIPFAPARPASGRLDAAAIAALAPALRHHLALTVPRRLLVMGDAPARALLGIGIAEARGRAHSIDVGGKPLPTIASFHPRFILHAASPEDRTNRRRTVWADLQQYMAL